MPVTYEQWPERSQRIRRVGGRDYQAVTLEELSQRYGFTSLIPFKKKEYHYCNPLCPECKKNPREAVTF